MNVSPIRISAKSLLRCIRDAAASSSNVTFIPTLDKESMGGMMTFQQAMSCLQKGVIVGNPQLNEHGHWELHMQRYAANFMFNLRVVAVCDGALVTRLFVFPAVESL